MYHMSQVMCHVSRVRYHVSYVTSVWLPSLLPLNWESSKTFFVQHLQLCVPIPLSGVWEHLVEIWGFLKSGSDSEVTQGGEILIQNQQKKCRNFWTNDQILISFEIWSLQNIFYYSKPHNQHWLRYCTIKASPGFRGPANTCDVTCHMYFLILYFWQRAGGFVINEGTPSSFIIFCILALTIWPWDSVKYLEKEH